MNFIAQSTAYKALVEAANSESIVVVFDFASKLPSIQSFRELTADFYDQTTINDLVLVAIWNDKKGKRQHQFYDYLSEDPKHDSRYVRCVRLQLLMC
jgi:hypothetical protein